jgi:hypothetical protein
MNKIIVWGSLIIFGMLIGFCIGGLKHGNIIREEIIFPALSGQIIQVHQSNYDVNLLSEKTCFDNCKSCFFVRGKKVIP